MIIWNLEYYDSVLPLVSVKSDTTFSSAPKEGVVFLWVKQSIDGQEFSMKCQGWDHYFLIEEDGGVRFGGWLDLGSPYGTGGRDYFWKTGENHQAMTPILGQPDDIEDQYIKAGVYVPRPDSITLGLE